MSKSFEEQSEELGRAWRELFDVIAKELHIFEILSWLERKLGE